MAEESGNKVTGDSAERGTSLDPLNADLIGQLFNLPLGHLFVVLVGAAILCGALWHEVSSQRLLVWLVCFTIVQVGRHILIGAFKSRTPAKDALRTWEWLFELGILLASLLWAGAGIFLTPEDSLPHQFLVALVVAGATSAATVVYSSRRLAYTTAVLVPLVPLSVRNVYQGTEFEVTLGIMLLLFAVALLAAGARMHHMIVTSFRLRYERDSFIKSLKREKEKVDDLNNELEIEVLDRKLAAEALRRSRERYRSVVDTQTEWICRFSHRLRLNFVNDSFCRCIGQSSEELVGRSLLEFVHEDDQQEVVKFFSEVDQDHSYKTGEFRAVGPNAEVRWHQCTRRALYNEQDNLLEFQAVGRDVTDRKKAEEALKASEKLYRSLIETSKDVIWSLSLDMKYTYVSPSVVELLGYTADEIRQLPPLETLTPPSRERVTHALQEELEAELAGPRNGLTARFEEIEQYRKDGSLVTLEITTTFLRGPDGQPTGILGISRDITDRKLAEIRLKKSEAQYRQLVESMNDGLAVNDKDERLTLANDRLCEMLGYTQAEILQLSAYDLVDPSCREILEEQITRRKQGVEGGAYELALLTNGGRRLPVFVSARGIYENGGRLVGSFAVISDITERKHAEEVLRRSHTELEQRVSERTADLEEMNSQLMAEIRRREIAEQAARESENRFRTVFETARDCVFLKDKNCRYTHINPAMMALFEAPDHQIRRLKDHNLYQKEDADRLLDEDLRVLAGQVIESEHAVLMKGRRVTFSCVKMPMYDSTGRISGLCGIARDVTERRSQSSRIRVGEAEYTSHAMGETMKNAELAARGESMVLLLGESGSGKDFLASHIHSVSSRSGGPFFAINCAALAPELAESELFGHEKFAFTGAGSRKRGMLELAEGGTLLLNEVGELPLALQAKLLTFLDTRSFTRVGGEQPVEVSARLIAATNRNLMDEVTRGRFREDLFHRLNVFTIYMPPLRDRIEDLPVLVETILDGLCRKLGHTEPPPIDSRCMEMLVSYNWPGNIRELKNVLERALILSEGAKVAPETIRLWESPLENMPDDKWSLTVRFPENQSLNDVTMQVKRELLKEALRRSDGVKKEAAKLLRITPDSFKHHAKSLNR